MIMMLFIFFNDYCFEYYDYDYYGYANNDFHDNNYYYGYHFCTSAKLFL